MLISRLLFCCHDTSTTSRYLTGSLTAICSCVTEAVASGTSTCGKLSRGTRTCHLNVITGNNVLGAEIETTTWTLMPRAANANAKMLPNQVTHHVMGKKPRS